MSEAQVTSRLIHGDCLEVMPTLERGSVAMVFADLPYGTTQCHWDILLPMPALWAEMHGVTTPTANHAFTATHPFIVPLIMSWPKGFRYELIWQKTRPGGAMLAKTRPMRDHENILLFYAKFGTYNPQKVAVTSSNSYRPKTEYVSHKQSAMFGGKKRNKPVIARRDDGTRHPRTIQKFGSLKSTHYLHPTQKPVALIEWLIKSYTNLNDTILDPCAGSGTTAIAALRTGRHSICIEKDKNYFEIMTKRVAEERAKLGGPR